MMWEIVYVDPDTSELVTFYADFDQITDELNGDSYCSFWLPNTEENRALVNQDLPVAVWFNEALMFSGILSAADLTGTKIKAVLYDAVILALDQSEPVTAVYDTKPADDILAAVLDADPTTGVSLAACPSTPISVVLYKANRLDVVKFIADALGMDYWPSNGTEVNVGVRGDGVYWSISRLTVSKRGIDRSKQADKVIIRGIDQYGVHLTGEAGAGSKVRTFNETTACDQSTLAAMATKKLAELQTGSSGAPVSTLISLGYQFNVGDYVYVYKPKYLLDGNYRIMQLTKKKTRVSMQLDRIRKSLDKTVADLRRWEEKGIYLPGATSWTLNLQGLVGLYHLNEGLGTKAVDSSKTDAPVDGVIVNGHWEDGPVTKMLTLQGDGQINLGPTLTFQSCKFAVGAWFSPSSLAAGTRYLVLKFNQFSMQHVGLNGVLRFNVVDAAGVGHDFDSDAGVVTDGGRIDAAVTYDGSYIRMYINGYLHKSWAFTGALYSVASDVYLGTNFEGVLANVHFWYRNLLDQEVLELHFFPLNRVVAPTNPLPDWIIPPQACGIMAVINGGSTTVPVISEEAALTTTPLETATVSEAGALSTTPLVTAAISEAGAAGLGTAIDSYAVANRDEGQNLQATHPSAGASLSACFQSFVVDASDRVLLCAQFYLRKYGTPTGSLMCAIYAHSGTYGTSSVPTGSPLEVSSQINIASLTTSDVLYLFNFNGATTLSASTNYVAVIYVASSANIGASHYVIVGRDGSSPSHGGNSGKYASSAWAAENTKDAIFYVFRT